MMRIAICIDYSSFTEHFLQEIQKFTKTFADKEITAIHVVDEILLTSGTGYELQLGETLNEENKKLEALCEQYLGEVNYLPEFGIPRNKIDEVLSEIDYDLLIIGKQSRSTLGERLLGGIAEHLLRNTEKPLLIIP